VRESAAVEDARRALGAKLAAHRRAAGYSQDALADQAGYSRSTIANVETGRQRVPPEFWATADGALNAEGLLIQASQAIETAARQERAAAARQADPAFLAITDRPDGSPAQLPATSGRCTARAAGHGDGWPDAVAMAAGSAREQAESAAVTEIGPGTIEQFTADVVRLGRDYVSAPPLPLFAAMHQDLGRIQVALQRKAYPAQARDLNFLAGALCGLMANASLDLGREDAADDLGRAAWTYGRVIDHGPLMGWARGTQALAAIWDHRYLDAIQHAEEGLGAVPGGMGAVRLHAIRARALAAHGDHGQARAALEAAGAARETAGHDDLHAGIAGEFAFDDAKLFYYEALALADSGDPVRIERAALAAIRIYEATPARRRSYGCTALARVQLARARLMRGKPDEAAEALSGVLDLDPQLRIDSLAEPLDACRQLLGSPSFRSSAAARQLDRRLAAFSVASVTHALATRR
jgi:transcriptional regulator with XRE-family HTH domain